jgi:hypothetical protein
LVLLALNTIKLANEVCSHCQYVQNFQFSIFCELNGFETERRQLEPNRFATAKSTDDVTGQFFSAANSNQLNGMATIAAQNSRRLLKMLKAIQLSSVDSLLQLVLSH